MVESMERVNAVGTRLYTSMKTDASKWQRWEACGLLSIIMGEAGMDGHASSVFLGAGCFMCHPVPVTLARIILFFLAASVAICCQMVSVFFLTVLLFFLATVVDF